MPRGRLLGARASVSNPEGRSGGLRALMARSHQWSDGLCLRSLETALHGRIVCFRNDAALENSAGRANPLWLKRRCLETSRRHLLKRDGKSMVRAESVRAGRDQFPQVDRHAAGQARACSLQWNSHVYVSYGVVCDEMYDDNGGPLHSIRKFLLRDTRYSDSRREVVFDRENRRMEQGPGHAAVDGSAAIASLFPILILIFLQFRLLHVSLDL